MEAIYLNNYMGEDRFLQPAGASNAAWREAVSDVVAQVLRNSPEQNDSLANDVFGRGGLSPAQITRLAELARDPDNLTSVPKLSYLLFHSAVA